MWQQSDLAHEVHLWYLPTTKFSEADLANHAASVLSQAERERAARFVFAKDQRSYITAHWLLRSVLSSYAPLPPATWEFVCTPRGKPFLAAPHDALGLSFNLSHTAGMVACAVTGLGEVGVDVETVRPRDHLNLARRYFAPLEIAQLESLSNEDQAEVFFRLWTLKEAYIKAQGLGLAMDLASFAFPHVQKEEITIAFAQEGDETPAEWFFFRHEPDADHKIAVAVKRGMKDVPRLRIFDDIPPGEFSGSSLQ